MFRKSSLEARKSSDYSARMTNQRLPGWVSLYPNPIMLWAHSFSKRFACQTIFHLTDFFPNSICNEKQTWPNVRTIDMISSSLQHSFDKILYTFHPKKLASTKLKRILNLRCKDQSGITTQENWETFIPPQFAFSVACFQQFSLARSYH